MEGVNIRPNDEVIDQATGERAMVLEVKGDGALYRVCTVKEPRSFDESGSRRTESQKRNVGDDWWVFGTDVKKRPVLEVTHSSKPAQDKFQKDDLEIDHKRTVDCNPHVVQSKREGLSIKSQEATNVGPRSSSFRPLRKKRPRPQDFSPAVQFQYEQSPDGVDENLLIFFHGLGDDEKSFFRLGKKMSLPQTAVMSLRAPTELPFGLGFEWFTSFDQNGDLIGPREGDRRRVNSLSTTLDALERFLRTLHEKCDWDARKMFLFGYAQGGTVALELLHRLRMRRNTIFSSIGGLVGIAASFLPETLENRHQDANQFLSGESTNAGRGCSLSQTPLLLVHGARDMMTPISLAQQTALIWRLTDRGSDVRLKDFLKGGEMLSSQEMEEVMKFFSEYLSRRYVALEDDCIEITPGSLERL